MSEQDIFIAALQQEPAQRAAYLDRTCGDDAALRQRVDVLLEAHERAGSFMQQPAAGEQTAAHGSISEGPGTVIGPYKLLQQIGEGGFGVVYMAEQQEPVRRKVALKIIKPGMDTKEVIARFESERQALALMDHPNVARVLDAGMVGPVCRTGPSSGPVRQTGPTCRPYFVMELVKGVPITEFCDKNHLPTAGRLELFRAVCLAVQHAHQKGIIHRDLKPSNILVTLHDGQPVPKVIDFGVAKATSQQLTQRTLFTAYGQMVGTPAYMSPEQAEMSGLDIDTRSDIYSLGVLLYELLTGTTPLESKRLRQAGYAEMQRLIREEEPPRPSTRLSSLGGEATVLAGNRGTDVKRLAQLLRGDLDWIVMKALEKDRNRRYETPSAFAADVERFLHNEAILARPPSALYKLRKFVRRNRAPVLTSAAVLLLLVVGITGTTLGLVWAMQAEDDARRDADRARDAEQVAEERLVDVKKERDAADNARRDAVTAAKRLAGALAQVDSLRLAAHSTLVVPEYPGTALLLALAAADKAPARTAFHNNALLRAVRECREERTLFAQPYTTAAGRPGRTEFVALQLTPDGTRAVVVCIRRDDWPEWSKNASAYVYDLQTGEVAATLKLPGLLFETMAISPDGRLLAAVPNQTAVVRYADGATAAFTDRTVRLWDLRTGAEVRVLKGHTDKVCSLCFDAKGERLLSASWDGTARVWDVATGQTLHVLRDGKVSLRFADFSPDPEGRRVITIAHPDGVCHSDSSIDRIRNRQFREPVDPKRVVFDPPVHAGAAIRWIEYVNSITNSGLGTWAPRLWDAQTGKRLAVLGEDKEAYGRVGGTGFEHTVAAFSPDGERVVTAVVERSERGADNSGVRLWDARDGKAIVISRLLPGPGVKHNDAWLQLEQEGKPRLRLVRSAFENAASEALLVWQQSEQAPQSWRCAAGSLRFSRGAGHRIPYYPAGDIPMFLDASDTPSTQLASSFGETVTIQTLDRNPICELRGHEGQVRAAAFLPGGKRLVTAAMDGTLRLWKVDHSDPVLEMDRPNGHPAGYAAFLHGDKHVITAGDRNAFGPLADKRVGLFDAATGTLVHEIVNEAALATSKLQRELLGNLIDLDVSLDGTQLVTVHDDANVTTAESDEAELQPSELFTPVRVWDLRTGKQRFALHGLRRNVSTVRFSPDGRRILTLACAHLNARRLDENKALGGLMRGGTMYTRVDLWDADTGKHLRSLVPEAAGLGSFAVWSPDGTRVLTNAHVFVGVAAVIHDVATGARPVILKDHSGITDSSIAEAAFSPDGKLVFGYRRAGLPGLRGLELIEVWDAATGAHRFTLRGHTGNVLSAVFSPDSRLILSTSADGTARLWDAATGAVKQVLHGHRQGVRAGCFSPDGKLLATASTDGTVRIWITATGQEWMTLPLAETEFTSVAFSADGGRLLTTSSDGTARIWPVDPLPLAVARKPRELTADERVRFQIEPAP